MNNPPDNRTKTMAANGKIQDSTSIGFTHKPISSVVQVITSPVDKKTLPGEIPVVLCNYTDVYYNPVITKAMPFMAATANEREIKRFSLQQGDVVITKDSETTDDIGVPAYVESVKANLLCGYHLAILRPGKNINGRYLAYILGHARIRHEFHRYANGITRFGLTADTYNKVCIPILPLAQQKRDSHNPANVGHRYRKKPRH